MNKPLFALVFLSGGAVGAFAGYKLAERNMMAEFEEAVELETNAIRARYVARQAYASPQEAVNALSQVPEAIQETMAVYAGGQKEPVAYHRIKPSSVQAAEKEEEIKPEPIVEENIFDKPVERGPIYVISELEYEHERVEENGKVDMTYYVEDDVLVDFADDLYPKPEDAIGDALHRFGEKTEDPDQVFVRNTNTSMDYVIRRDPGSYWRSVHGMEPADAPPSGREG